MADCFFKRCGDKEACTCPQPGTFAFTAWLMAGVADGPVSEEDGEFWDNWKEEMKEAEL